MTFGRQKVPLTPVHHEYRAEHDRNDGKRRQARDQVVRECADDDAGTSGYFGKGYDAATGIGSPVISTKPPRFITLPMP